MCTPVQKTCSFSRCIYPILKGGIHSGLIMAGGDIMAQAFIETSEIDVEKLNWRRTVKFGVIGLLYGGPLISLWNGIMARFIMRRAPLFEKALNKTFCTQLYLAPTLNIGIITLSTMINEEKFIRELMEQSMNRDFINIMEKNYMVWPITQFACATLKPMMKFLILSTVSVFWSAYLSTVLMGGNSSKWPKIA